jgi:hypothetical protein
MTFGTPKSSDPAPRRMTIAGLFTRERTNPEPGSHRILDCYGRTMGKEQWSAVLGVKPAIEDVDANGFLAFLLLN